MKSSARALIIGTLFLLATVVVGVIGYLLAGWSLIDSVFMVIITIFGVGYGEVRQESPELRIFTMGIILAGCTSLIYLIGGFIQFLTEGEIRRTLEKRRMKTEIHQLNQHVIVCGLGRIGRMLAAELTRAGRSFVVIETDTNRIEDAECLVCEGDATEEETLLRAGIERAAVLATVLPNDAANVFITLSARNLNSQIQIIARGEAPSTKPKLLQAGADRVVLPAHIGAERIAHQILHPSTENLLQDSSALQELDVQLGEFGIQFAEMEIPGDSTLVGATLSEVETRSKAQFLVVALHRIGGEQLLHPKPDTRIEADDRLIFVCHTNEIVEFTKNEKMKHRLQYRGATL